MNSKIHVFNGISSLFGILFSTAHDFVLFPDGNITKKAQPSK
jgi:hypothetical protein